MNLGIEYFYINSFYQGKWNLTILKQFNCETTTYMSPSVVFPVILILHNIDNNQWKISSSNFCFWLGLVGLEVIHNELY